MNKRSPDVGSTSQPFKRQAGGAPQIKPVVLQRQRVVASPRAAFAPQIKPTSAQLKNPPSERVKSPVAPDVYRPQTVPRVLQTKSLKTQIMQAGPNCPPPAQTGVQAKISGLHTMATHSVAPPRYKPQPDAHCLQTKKLAKRNESVIAPEQHKPAPRGYSPQPASKCLQSRRSPDIFNSSISRTTSTAPRIPRVHSAKGAGSRPVIQRAAAYYADYHCGVCNENFSYGYKAAPPSWLCEGGHLNWLPGAVAAPAAAAPAAGAGAAPPPPAKKGGDKTAAKLYKERASGAWGYVREEESTNKNHAEELLVGLIGKAAKRWNVVLNAWPCTGEGHHNCHKLLADTATKQGVTIVVEISDDHAGYAVNHGKAAKATGTITYAPDTEPAYS